MLKGNNDAGRGSPLSRLGLKLVKYNTNDKKNMLIAAFLVKII